MRKIYLKFRKSNILLTASIFYIPISIALYYGIPGFGIYFLYPIIIPIIYILSYSLKKISDYIDILLLEHISNIQKYSFYSLTYPSYKFVDVFRAVENYCNKFTNHIKILSVHGEDLNNICNSNFAYDYDGSGGGKVQTPEMLSWAVDYKQDLFFPEDLFYVIPSGDNQNDTIILRIKYQYTTSEAIIEYTVKNPETADQIKQEINQYSHEKSIYKNKVLEVSVEREISDELGEIEQPVQLKINFKTIIPIQDDDIILDKEIQEMIQRNVFDYHEKRDIFLKHGLPAKKAILFFGPPGTGKTFTSQYIYNKLKNITTIVVTGSSLGRIKSVCNLAHVLQPSLVIIEDVDLIFTSREINMYSSALGDFMDELDGFQKDDAVIFILTTNAIERLEPAIKDRPGRISQCIYFAPPGNSLRERYIKKYIKIYDYNDLNIKEIIEMTKGASQAFLKELIQRAVHFSIEENQFTTEKVKINNHHFSKALKEIIHFDNSSTNLILGYQKDIL